MENLIASVITSLIWGAVIVPIFAILELIPVLKLFPRLKYFGGMALISVLVFALVAGGYVRQSGFDFIFTLIALGLGWWYAYGGVKHWTKKLQALDHSSGQP